MGLDIYVGPLTRYHSGNWETLVQQYARLNGLKCQVVRPPSTDSSPRLSADQIREAVLAWQSGLAEALKQPLKWSEDNSSDYFTEKPAWDCYSAVAVLAAHDEHRELKLPDVVPEDLIVRARAADVDSGREVAERTRPVAGDQVARGKRRPADEHNAAQPTSRIECKDSESHT